MNRKKRNRNKQARKEKLPVYCDFTCRYAAFADENSVGACRREQAVYCRLIKKCNNKNSVCITNK